jgi:hypothetical protein
MLRMVISWTWWWWALAGLCKARDVLPPFLSSFFFFCRVGELFRSSGKRTRIDSRAIIKATKVGLGDGIYTDNMGYVDCLEL